MILNLKFDARPIKIGYKWNEMVINGMKSANENENGNASPHKQIVTYK